MVDTESLMLVSASELEELAPKRAAQIKAHARRYRVIGKEIDAFNARTRLVVKPERNRNGDDAAQELMFETRSPAWLNALQVRELEWVYMWQV